MPDELLTCWLHGLCPTKGDTYLVEILQQIDYPAFHLILGESRGSRIKSDSLRREARCELSAGRNNRGTVHRVRNRRSDGARHRGSQRADNSGTEHGGYTLILLEKNVDSK